MVGVERRRFHLDGHLVERAGPGDVQFVVVGESGDAADEVLHRGRVHVGAPDGHHEVAAAEHDAGQVRPRPAATVVGVEVAPHEVVGAVLDERLGEVRVAGDDVLADLARFEQWFAGLGVGGVAVHHVLDGVHPAGPIGAALGHVHGLADAVGVHDYRTGNLLYDCNGITGVLDWEMARPGDPLEDVAWAQLASWRVGTGLVGALLSDDDWVAAYEDASGQPVDRDALRFWQVLTGVKMSLLAWRAVERTPPGKEHDLLRTLFSQLQDPLRQPHLSTPTRR